MAIEDGVNMILKEMWRLDEKLGTIGSLDPTEKEFFNTHLDLIIQYYTQNSTYWKNKIPL
jgi:hypothetical protein